MKKATLILLFAVLLLTACDPAHTSEFAIDNRTDHALTIQSLQPVDTVRSHYAMLYPLSAPAHTDSVVDVQGGIGTADLGEFAYLIPDRFYGDSVQIRFDDGRVLTFYRDSVGADALYRINDANAPASLYRYEGRPNPSGPFKGYMGYGKLTLVVTDSLYNLSRLRL